MKARIRIDVHGGKRSASVDAHVFGKWAAHPMYQPAPWYEDSWVVTFIPNGKRISTESLGPCSEGEAIRVAQSLASTPIHLWMNPDAETADEQPEDVHWIAQAIIAEALASPTVAIHVSNRTADALEAAARERGCTVEELLEQALAKVGVQ